MIMTFGEAIAFLIVEPTTPNMCLNPVMVLNLLTSIFQ